VAFSPPSSVVYDSKGAPVQTQLLAVPSGPGTALVFTTGVSTHDGPPVGLGDILSAALRSGMKAALPLLGR
jgi:hypothetical protein